MRTNPTDALAITFLLIGVLTFFINLIFCGQRVVGWRAPSKNRKGYGPGTILGMGSGYAYRRGVRGGRLLVASSLNLFEKGLVENAPDTEILPIPIV